MDGHVLDAADSNPQTAKPRKSFWETIFTTTPVFMTVVATLLAGLSSSAMTQAQYYRSLAAQFQSKAGDQWGFFQAKRIRGSTLELTVDLLHASGQPLAESLPATVARLGKQCQGAEKQTESFVKLLAGDGVVRVDFVPSKEVLRQAADKFLQTLRETKKATVALQDKMAPRLASAEAKLALTYLASQALPATGAQQQRATAIERACAVVRNRKSDDEVRTVMAGIQARDLQEAIAAAEAQAAAFDKSTAPVARAIDELGSLVADTVKLAHAVQRGSRDFAGMTDLSDDKSTSFGKALARITQTVSGTKTAADELTTEFKAARHSFKARCYEHEARQNQAVAELYELQVSLNSAISERHRQRSKNFFYGMLAAQAGVTIASISLAVRRKSILWGLASIAGLGAICFGTYVYLCM